MPLLDARTKADTLVGKFISDIVLQILFFVVENERAAIRQREGIAAAKLRGTKFGRPAKVYNEEFKSIVQQYNNGKPPLPNSQLYFKIGKHLIFGVSTHLEGTRTQRRVHKGTLASEVSDYVLVIIYFTYYC